MTSTSLGEGGTGSTTAPRKGVTRVAPAPGRPEKEDRDPNHLNSHIVVDFYSVFAEPKDVRSFDCTWEFSELCYDLFYNCIYGILTFFCGCWIAIYWGLQMVPLVFTHVWCFTPFTVCVKNICGNWCGTLWLILARCCVAPCAKACAPFFRHCGDPNSKPPPTPPIFQSGKRYPKKKPKEEAKVEAEPVTQVVVVPDPEPKHFDDYDKTKIAASVRRQMMLI